MEPEQVNPKNFDVINILYDNESFSIAYGIWEGGTTHLAMRWNGESDEDPGYPKLFNHPIWFLISEELKIPILKTIIDLNGSRNDDIIEALRRELQSES